VRTDQCNGFIDARLEAPSRRSGSEGPPAEMIQSGFPTVIGLHDVVSCDIAPRDENLLQPRERIRSAQGESPWTAKRYSGLLSSLRETSG